MRGLLRLGATLAIIAAFLHSSAATASAADADNYIVTRIRFYPRPGQAARMKDGRFSGSITSATNDFETLAAIKETPADNQWNEIDLSANKNAWRFVKWESPAAGQGNIAEIEFYAGDRKLTGQPFGTTSAIENPNNKPEYAFDSNNTTYFTSIGDGPQFVGIDLGEQSQASAPKISVPSGQYPLPQAIILATTTPGATIRYSIDGSGSLADAAVYDKPITIAKSAILQAAAFKPGLAPSPTIATAYRISDSSQDAGAVSSFHIGNSLTDTVNGLMDTVCASAGHPLRFYRFTIPGAPTEWLWDHPGSGFGETRYAEAFIARAPITHLITQPFAGHNRSIENEAAYSGRFYDLARQYSPDVQPWLYVQWPDKTFKDGWSAGRAAAKVSRKPQEIQIGNPATAWQEAVANHMRYVELVKHKMDEEHLAQIKSGKAKPVLIIPAGLALAMLKTEVDAGRVPGISDFFAEHFSDDLHLSKKGAYLVTLVHYACFFKESPEGKVPASLGGLTDEQAKVYQQLAWNAVITCKFTGIPQTARK